MKKTLANKSGRNVELYINDIIVKNMEAVSHTIDLQETKLNLKKCMFRVQADKLLGFLVS